MNVPKTPTMKLLIFGVGGWLLSKFLDACFDWFCSREHTQKTIIQIEFVAQQALAADGFAAGAARRR